MDQSAQDEIRAINRCRTGSRKAFESIVHRYMKDAYFIALWLVGNHEDALDLSQEAFARAYTNIGQLRSSRGFFPWFYQILRNLCFTHLKKRRKGLEQPLGADEYEHLQGDENCQPEAIVERNEQKQRIREAIKMLDDKHREVIILRHFRGMSYEQIARNLFCNEGTVTSRLYYARKRLKEILSEKGGRQL
ncbi:MAG: sigma-70 family RNA polymerase sigma factor [Planctomycetota bacterium]